MPSKTLNHLWPTILDLFHLLQHGSRQACYKNILITNDQQFWVYFLRKQIELPGKNDRNSDNALMNVYYSTCRPKSMESDLL